MIGESCSYGDSEMKVHEKEVSKEEDVKFGKFDVITSIKLEPEEFEENTTLNTVPEEFQYNTCIKVEPVEFEANTCIKVEPMEFDPNEQIKSEPVEFAKIKCEKTEKQLFLEKLITIEAENSRRKKEKKIAKRLAKQRKNPEKFQQREEKKFKKKLQKQIRKRMDFKSNKLRKIDRRFEKQAMESFNIQEHQKYGLKLDLIRGPMKMSDSSCKLRICFDLSLINGMTSSEFTSATASLLRCYTINRKADAPLQMYITGYPQITNGSTNLLHSSCFNWDVHFDSKHYTNLFKRKDIVYITRDSPNVLEYLDHDKCYVVPAFVDHSKRKNINGYQTAIIDKVSHVRFPLDDYLTDDRELNFQQVYCFLLRLTEGKSWSEAGDEILAYT